MRYDYTWAHIRLFAKMCGPERIGESITATWVNLVEEHHRKTFPFTLWPLSYRTSDVTTSPSMCSPMRITSAELGVEYEVSVYKCNEIIVVCVRDTFHSGNPPTMCTKARNPELGIENGVRDHVVEHSTDPTLNLTECGVSQSYYKMKDVLMASLYEYQDSFSEETDCIVCIGHGPSSSIASCIAVDLAGSYEEERDFLSLEKKGTEIDFIGFGNPVHASKSYWDASGKFVDNYIRVVLEKRSHAKSIDPVLIPHPGCEEIVVEGGSTKKRSFFFKKKPGRLSSIQSYIDALDKKIDL